MPGYMCACKGKAGMKARYCAAEISGRKDPRCGDMRQYSALACRAVLSLSRREKPDACVLDGQELAPCVERAFFSLFIGISPSNQNALCIFIDHLESINHSIICSDTKGIIRILIISP